MDFADRYGLSAQFRYDPGKSFPAMRETIFYLEAIARAANGVSDALGETHIGRSFVQIAKQTQKATASVKQQASQLQDYLKPLRAEFRALRAESRNIDLSGLKPSDGLGFRRAARDIQRYIKSLKALERQVKGTSAAEREFVANLRQQQKAAATRLEVSMQQRKAAIASERVGDSRDIRDAGRLGLRSLVAVGSEAIQVLTSFNDQMAAVEAVMDASERNEENMQRLRQKAKELGASTRFSASEAASGLVLLAQAGYKVNQQLSAVDGTLKLAAAGNLDLQQATEITLSTLGGFQLGADAAVHVADVLARTANSAALDVTDLGESMKYVGPAAKAFGANVEQTNAALGVLSEAGIKASTAGTALRAIFLRLAAPTDKAKSYIDQLGIALSDSKGNMRSLDLILEEMNLKMSEMGEAQRLDYVKRIFGTEASSAAIYMMEHTKRLQEFTRLNYKASAGMGAAAETAKIMEREIGGAFRSMRSAYEGVLIEIGEVLEPTVKRATIALTRLFTMFIELPRPIKQTIVQIGMLSAGLSALAIVAGTVGVVLFGLQQAMSTSAIAMISLQRGIIPLTGFFETAISAFSEVSLLSNLLFFSVQTIALVGAFSLLATALGALVYLFRDDLRNALEASQGILLGLAKSLGFLMGISHGVASVLLGEITPVALRLQQVHAYLGQIQQTIRSLRVAFEKLGAAYQKGFGSGEEVGRRVAQAIVDRFVSAAEYVSGAWERARASITQAWDRMVQTAASIRVRLIGLLNHGAADVVAASWWRTLGSVVEAWKAMVQEALHVRDRIIALFEKGRQLQEEFFTDPVRRAEISSQVATAIAHAFQSGLQLSRRFAQSIAQNMDFVSLLLFTVSSLGASLVRYIRLELANETLDAMMRGLPTAFALLLPSITAALIGSGAIQNLESTISNLFARVLTKSEEVVEYFFGEKGRKKIEEFTNALREIGAAAQEAAGFLSSMIQQVLVPLFHLQPVVDRVLGALAGALLGSVESPFTALRSALIGSIAGFSGFVPSIFLTTTLDGFVQLIRSGREFLALLRSIGETLFEIAKAAGYAVRAIYGIFKFPIDLLVAAITPAFDLVYSRITNTTKVVQEQVSSVIKNALLSAIRLVPGLEEVLVRAYSTTVVMLGRLRRFSVALVNYLRDVVENARIILARLKIAENIKGIFSSLSIIFSRFSGSILQSTSFLFRLMRAFESVKAITPIDIIKRLFDPLSAEVEKGYVSKLRALVRISAAAVQGATERIPEGATVTLKLLDRIRFLLPAQIQLLGGIALAIGTIYVGLKALNQEAISRIPVVGNILAIMRIAIVSIVETLPTAIALLKSLGMIVSGILVGIAGIATVITNALFGVLNVFVLLGQGLHLIVHTLAQGRDVVNQVVDAIQRGANIDAPQWAQVTLRILSKMYIVLHPIAQLIDGLLTALESISRFIQGSFLALMLVVVAINLIKSKGNPFQAFVDTIMFIPKAISQMVRAFRVAIAATSEEGRKSLEYMIAKQELSLNLRLVPEYDRQFQEAQLQRRKDVKRFQEALDREVRRSLRQQNIRPAGAQYSDFQIEKERHNIISDPNRMRRVAYQSGVEAFRQLSKENATSYIAALANSPEEYIDRGTLNGSTLNAIIENANLEIKRLARMGGSPMYQKHLEQLAKEDSAYLDAIIQAHETFIRDKSLKAFTDHVSTMGRDLDEGVQYIVRLLNLSSKEIAGVVKNFAEFEKGDVFPDYDLEALFNIFKERIGKLSSEAKLYKLKQGRAAAAGLQDLNIAEQAIDRLESLPFGVAISRQIQKALQYILPGELETKGPDRIARLETAAKTSPLSIEGRLGRQMKLSRGPNLEQLANQVISTEEAARQVGILKTFLQGTNEQRKELMKDREILEFLIKRLNVPTIASIKESSNEQLANRLSSVLADANKQDMARTLLERLDLASMKDENTGRRTARSIAAALGIVQPGGHGGPPQDVYNRLIKAIENGDLQTVPAQYLTQIARASRVSVGDLLMPGQVQASERASVVRMRERFLQARMKESGIADRDALKKRVESKLGKSQAKDFNDETFRRVYAQILRGEFYKINADILKAFGEALSQTGAKGYEASVELERLVAAQAMLAQSSAESSTVIGRLRKAFSGLSPRSILGVDEISFSVSKRLARAGVERQIRQEKRQSAEEIRAKALGFEAQLFRTGSSEAQIIEAFSMLRSGLGGAGLLSLLRGEINAAELEKKELEKLAKVLNRNTKELLELPLESVQQMMRQHASKNMTAGKESYQRLKNMVLAAEVDLAEIRKIPNEQRQLFAELLGISEESLAEMAAFAPSLDEKITMQLTKLRQSADERFFKPLAQYAANQYSRLQQKVKDSDLPPSIKRLMDVPKQATQVISKRYQQLNQIIQERAVKQIFSLPELMASQGIENFDQLIASLSSQGLEKDEISAFLKGPQRGKTLSETIGTEAAARVAKALGVIDFKIFDNTVAASAAFKEFDKQFSSGVVAPLPVYLARQIAIAVGKAAVRVAKDVGQRLGAFAIQKGKEAARLAFAIAGPPISDFIFRQAERMGQAALDIAYQGFRIFGKAKLFESISEVIMLSALKLAGRIREGVAEATELRALLGSRLSTVRETVKLIGATIISVPVGIYKAITSVRWSDIYNGFRAASKRIVDFFRETYQEATQDTRTRKLYTDLLKDNRKQQQLVRQQIRIQEQLIRNKMQEIDRLNRVNRFDTERIQQEAEILRQMEQRRRMLVEEKESLRAEQKVISEQLRALGDIFPVKLAYKLTEHLQRSLAKGVEFFGKAAAKGLKKASEILENRANQIDLEKLRPKAEIFRRYSRVQGVEGRGWIQRYSVDEVSEVPLIKQAMFRLQELAKETALKIAARLSDAAQRVGLSWQSVVNRITNQNWPELVAKAIKTGIKIVRQLNHGAADATGDAWERNTAAIKKNMDEIANAAEYEGARIRRSPLAALGKLFGAVAAIGGVGVGLSTISQFFQESNPQLAEQLQKWSEIIFAVDAIVGSIGALGHVMGGFIDFLTDESLTGFVKDVRDKVVEIGGKAYETFGGFLKPFMEEAKVLSGKVVGVLKQALEPAQKVMTEFGTKLAKSLGKAFASGAKYLADAVRPISQQFNLLMLQLKQRLFTEVSYLGVLLGNFKADLESAAAKMAIKMRGIGQGLNNILALSNPLSKDNQVITFGKDGIVNVRLIEDPFQIAMGRMAKTTRKTFVGMLKIAKPVFSLMASYIATVFAALGPIGPIVLAIAAATGLLGLAIKSNLFGFGDNPFVKMLFDIGLQITKVAAAVFMILTPLFLLKVAFKFLWFLGKALIEQFLTPMFGKVNKFANEHKDSPIIAFLTKLYKGLMYVTDMILGIGSAADDLDIILYSLAQDTIAGLGLLLKNCGVYLVGAIGAGILAAIAGVPSMLAVAIGATVGLVLKRIGDMVSLLRSRTRKDFSLQLKITLRNLAQNAIDGLDRFLNEVSKFLLVAIPAGILAAIAGVPSMLAVAIGATVGLVFEAIVNKGLRESLRKFLGFCGQLIQSEVGKFLLVAIPAGILAAMAGVPSMLAVAIGTTVGLVFEAIVNKGLRESFGKFLGFCGQLIQGIVWLFFDFLQSAAEKFREFGRNLRANFDPSPIRDRVIGFFSEFVGLFASLRLDEMPVFGGMLKFLGKIINLSFEIGSALWSGLRSKVRGVQEWYAGLREQLVDPLQEALSLFSQILEVGQNLFAKLGLPKIFGKNPAQKPGPSTQSVYLARTPPDLSASAASAQKRWQQTSESIQGNLSEIATASADAGREVLGNMAEASPGPTYLIRQHWSDTTDALQDHMATIASTSESTGIILAKAMNPEVSAAIAAGGKYGAEIPKEIGAPVIIQYLLAEQPVPQKVSAGAKLVSSEVDKALKFLISGFTALSIKIFGVIKIARAFDVVARKLSLGNSGLFNNAIGRTVGQKFPSQPFVSEATIKAARRLGTALRPIQEWVPVIALVNGRIALLTSGLIAFSYVAEHGFVKGLTKAFPILESLEPALISVSESVTAMIASGSALAAPVAIATSALAALFAIAELLTPELNLLAVAGQYVGYGLGVAAGAFKGAWRALSDFFHFEDLFLGIRTYFKEVQTIFLKSFGLGESVGEEFAYNLTMGILKTLATQWSKITTWISNKMAELPLIGKFFRPDMYDLVMGDRRKAEDFNVSRGKIPQSLGSPLANPTLPPATNDTIEQRWQQTSNAIQSSLGEIVTASADAGREVLANVAEASPGPTFLIREHWGRTSDFVQSRISAIADSSAQVIDAVAAANAAHYEDFDWFYDNQAALEDSYLAMFANPPDFTWFDELQERTVLIQQQGLGSVLSKDLGTVRQEVEATGDSFMEFLSSASEAVQEMDMIGLQNSFAQFIASSSASIAQMSASIASAGTSMASFVMLSIAMMSPFTLALLGVGAIAVILALKFEGIRTAISGLLDITLSVAIGIIQTIRGVVKILGGIPAALRGDFTQIVEGWEDTIQALYSMAKGVMRGIAKVFEGGLSVVRQLFGGLADSVRAIFSELLQSARESAGKLVQTFRRPVEKVRGMMGRGTKVASTPQVAEALVDLPSAPAAQVRIPNISGLPDDSLAIEAFKMRQARASGLSGLADDMDALESKLSALQSRNRQAIDTATGGLTSLGLALNNFAPQIAAPLFLVGDLVNGFTGIQDVFKSVQTLMAGTTAANMAAAASGTALAGANTAVAGSNIAAAASGGFLASVNAVLSATFAAVATAAKVAWAAIAGPLLPIIVLIGLLVTAFFGLKNNFLGFRDAMMWALEPLTSGFSAMVDGLKNAFRIIGGAINSALTPLGTLVGSILSLFGMGGGGRSPLMNLLVLPFIVLLTPLRVVATVLGLAFRMIGAIAQLIAILLVPVIHTVLMPINLIVAALQLVFNLITGAVQLIGMAIAGIYNLIPAPIRWLLEQMAGGVISVAGAITGNAGSKPKGYATGGIVRGPGGPTDDRIPAMLSGGGMVMLSNGEMIINAKSTANNSPFLHAINSGMDAEDLLKIVPVAPPRVSIPSIETLTTVSGTSVRQASPGDVPPTQFNITIQIQNITITGGGQAAADEFVNALEPAMRQKLREWLRDEVEMSKGV